VCLPCDAGISGGFSGCFSGFFLVGFGLFGPGAARAPFSSLSTAGYMPWRIEYRRYSRLKMVLKEMQIFSLLGRILLGA